jgi:MFS family permease
MGHPRMRPSRNETDLRWNFGVNVLNNAFVSLSMSFISTTTILPVLISRLTPSKHAIGLILAIYGLGTSLPAVFAARRARALPRKLPQLLVLGLFGERLPLLAIAASVALLGTRAPTAAFLALAAGYAVLTFSVGYNTPAWFDLIAKVIPVRRRGLWSGLGNALGACLGVAGGAIAGTVLDRRGFPEGFALLYAFAFGGLMLSYLAMALNREPPGPAAEAAAGPLEHFRDLADLLRRDRDFRVFLASRTVGLLGPLASGFFIVAGVERFALDGASIGLLTGVLVGSQTLMNLLWGMLADRRGHKAVLAGSSLAMAAAAVVAGFLCFSPAWLVAAFVLLGVAQSGEGVSGSTIVLEYGNDIDRPAYIGLASTLLSPARSLAPLLGGALAASAGYAGLFACAAAASLLGGALQGLWLREPRGRNGQDGWTAPSSGDSRTGPSEGIHP